MERVEEGGEAGWRAALDLVPGDYRYAIRVDGHDRPDPFAPLAAEDPATGELLSLLRVEDCSAGEIRLDAASASAGGALSVEATYLKGERRLDPRSVRAEINGEPVEVSVRPGRGSISVSLTGLSPGKYTVVLFASDRDGLAAAPLRVPLWIEAEPFGWNGALLYQIVTDRFASDTGALDAPADPGARAGGTLRGITRRIEEGYFDELGVGALWLSPVYLNAGGLWPGKDGHDYSAYHGYWPISTSEIEPSIGTESDLRDLIASAHARGIRVLLDVVPNHVHEQHPYRSEHPDWFHEDPDCICGDYSCPWSDFIETCWFTEYLPDLALEDSDVARVIAADTVEWATRFDVDGFRVDAVPMMSRPAVRELALAARQQLGRGPTPFFLVGETFTSSAGLDSIAANLGPSGLDSQFHFPLLWALRDFASHGGEAEALDEIIIEAEERLAGSGAILSPFVGNHDMTRFITDASGDIGDPWLSPPPQPSEEEPYRRLLIATSLAMSMPGAPVLYYGDEWGLAGANDPDNRRVMPADGSETQRWLRDRVARAGRSRRCSEALREGSRETLLAEGPLYAMRRASGDEEVVVVLNASLEPKELALEGSPGPWVDVLEQETIPSLDVLSMPPLSARILFPERSDCATGDLVARRTR